MAITAAPRVSGSITVVVSDAITFAFPPRVALALAGTDCVSLASAKPLG